MDEHLYASLWLGAALVVLIALYITNRYLSGKTAGQPQPPVQVRAAGPAAPEPRRHTTVRQRMVANRAVVLDDSSEETEDEAKSSSAGFPSGKIGTKKMKRMEMKAERKAQREQEEQEREQKKKQDAALEEERKKEEERTQLLRQKQEEEELLRKEERNKKEHEEYLKLKETFVVEEQGECADVIDDGGESLLQKFVDYVKEQKVVLLDELAAEFGIKTKDAIDRINQLQEAGRLSGVWDERGKYIFISDKELHSLAAFIRQRGRVSISELAEQSNQIFMLQSQQRATPVQG